MPNVFDFNPTSINPFPYWKWNKVLPAVYDDSLSQYEILCKLLDAVNNIITSTNSTGEQVEQLTQLVQQLIDGEFPSGIVDYVNDIVTAAMADDIEAINATLDEMQETIDNNTASSRDFVEQAPYGNPALIYETFLTYAAHAKDNTFFYGAPSIFAQAKNATTGAMEPRAIEMSGSKFPISCTPLTMLLLMGISYNRSRYNTGNVSVIDGQTYLVGGENYPFSGNMLIDWHSDSIERYWQTYSDTGIADDSGSFYSSGLAHWLYDAGYLHEIKSQYPFNELCIGDILFYENDSGSSQYEHWNNINHCEIFLGWTSTSTMIVLTTTGNDTQTLKFVKRGSSNAIIPYLKWYARFSGNSYAPINNMLDGIMTGSLALPLSHSASTGGNYQFPRMDIGRTLKPDYAHTCVIKLADGYSGTNLRFNIYGAKSTDTTNYTQCAGYINTTNPASEIAPNVFYCTLLTNYMESNTPLTDINALRMTVAADSAYDVTIEDIAVYDRLIQPVI